MHLRFSAMAIAALIGWGVTLVGLALGDPTRTAPKLISAAAFLSFAAHLAGGLGFENARSLRNAPLDPTWVSVQAEKHRRKGTWFAAWGMGVAGLGLVAAWTGRPDGWPVWYAVGLNLGLQPGLFAAEFLGLLAKARLGRLVFEPEPASDLAV